MNKLISFSFILILALSSCGSGAKKDYTACECQKIMTNVKEENKEGKTWCLNKSTSDNSFQEEIAKCAAKEMGFDGDNVKVNTSIPSAPKQGTYTLDTKKSFIKWTGRKIAGSHYGLVNPKSGSFTMDENGLISSGNIVIDMTSITVTDIEDEKSNGDLVGHLKADDFFGVDKFGEATFEITGSEAIESANGAKTNFKVNGNLTIKGITKPATAMLVAVKSKNVEGNVSVAGALTFDRTEYGIKYNSGKFFDSLGDRMINDEVTLQITLVAS